MLHVFVEAFITHRVKITESAVRCLQVQVTEDHALGMELHEGFQLGDFKAGAFFGFEIDLSGDGVPPHREILDGSGDVAKKNMRGIKIIVGFSFCIRFKLHHAAAQTESADKDIPAFGIPAHLAVFRHRHQLGFVVGIGRSVAIIIPHCEKWFIDVQRTHEDLFLHDVEFIGLHFKGADAARHVLPHPAIPVEEADVFKIHFFEEEGDVWVRCLLLRIRRREGVNDELVIPYGVLAVEVHDGVFQAKIF